VEVAADAAPMPGMSAVRGQILEGSSPGAWRQVTLQGESFNTTVQADEQGRFTFENVPPGTYTVELVPMRPMENEETRSVTVTLDRPARVRAGGPRRGCDRSPQPYVAPPARRRVV